MTALRPMLIDPHSEARRLAERVHTLEQQLERSDAALRAAARHRTILLGIGLFQSLGLAVITGTLWRLIP